MDEDVTTELSSQSEKSIKVPRQFQETEEESVLYVRVIHFLSEPLDSFWKTLIKRTEKTVYLMKYLHC